MLDNIITLAVVYIAGVYSPPQVRVKISTAIRAGWAMILARFGIAPDEPPQAEAASTGDPDVVATEEPATKEKTE